MPATTIDEVLDALDTIIDRARRDESRLGYFPALYRKVTAEVKRGIAEGVFEDGPRMERLDVVFANRYLEAYEQYHNGTRPTRCWEIAFECGRRWRPIVLQHLLLGMNAHINLDLGIAAAQVAPGPEIESLRNDFFKINEILASLVEDVKWSLAEVWPALTLVNLVTDQTKDVLVNFRMGTARNGAWKTAQRLAALPEAEREAHIYALDHRMAVRARLLLTPGITASTVFFYIRLRERGSVPDIIDLLC